MMVGQVRDGFYVEAGATDFVVISNSLYFELNYGWTGMLAEGHPLYIESGYVTSVQLK